MTAHEILERRKACPLPSIKRKTEKRIFEVWLTDTGAMGFDVREPAESNPIGLAVHGYLTLRQDEQLELRDFLNELYPPGEDK